MRFERYLGVDFHKREDPRIKEAEARFQSGRYGTFQTAVFYMVDKLSVADPNHSPRFFASPDFAENNTPASFLTVHMADALMKIINLIPVRVSAIGYSHKLPSLKPIAVRGPRTWGMRRSCGPGGRWPSSDRADRPAYAPFSGGAIWEPVWLSRHCWD